MYVDNGAFKFRKEVPQSADTRPETSRCLWWSRMRLRHESSVWRGHNVLGRRRGWTMVRWVFVTVAGSQYGDDNLCRIAAKHTVYNLLTQPNNSQKSSTSW
jgi:hypothetical protein